MEEHLVIVVATYRRAPELKRLFASLEKVRMPLSLLIVDNADDPETEAVIRETPLDAERLVPGTNLGCGGGLAYGERAAMERFGDRFTHLWLLDDDTEVTPEVPERLMAALAQEKAALACPIIVNAAGGIEWFPGLLEPAPFKTVCSGGTPEEYREKHGTHPVRFSWATGVSLMTTREALEELGVHRDDFWIRGEDLDFSLRYSERYPAVFVPDALVKHLPRPLQDSPEATAAERIKHRVMIQNIAYISIHLPHGRRILRTLPGNVWRFLKTWGGGSIPEALSALWLGAVKGKPAGANR
jgi:GT2 family glycosyltransferase